MKRMNNLNGEIRIIILVRSPINTSARLRDTFRRFGLTRVHMCRAFESQDPSIDRMITKISDYVTWGTVTREEFLSVFGDINAPVMHDNPNDMLIIRPAHIPLHPPRKGFGGLKKRYDFKTKKGAIGDRGKDMILLLRRMIPKLNKETQEDKDAE